MLESEFQGPIYNQMMMGFLKEEIKKLEDSYDLCSMPDDQCHIIEDLCEKAKRLVQRHCIPFDLKKFYTANDVREAVESICKDLISTLRPTQPKQGSVLIQPRILVEYICKDETYMRHVLLYIFDGNPFLSAPVAVLKE